MGIIVGFLVVIVIGLAIPSITFSRPIKNGSRMEPAADFIWNTLTSSMYFLDEDVDKCRADVNCFEQVAEKWRKAGSKEKIQALGKFVDIGGQFKPAKDEVRRSYGPFLVEPHLLSATVEALSHEDSDLREAACRTLARETPDALVRNHAMAIEKALLAYPDVRDGTRLVGKLPSKRALKILEGTKILLEVDSLVLDAVFGKLGDHVRENALIEEYRTADDPRDKHEIALLLGYMAKPKSLMVLARDLRAPLFYEWNGKGKRSFRIHVIEALSLAYPMEPILWRPYSYPRSDEYYAEIENWASRVIGVEYIEPRPPFLYEDQVPKAKFPPNRKPPAP